MIAQPPEWNTYEAEERRFAVAENDRLLYVAATRAQVALVASTYPDGSTEAWRGRMLEDAPELPEVSVKVPERAVVTVTPVELAYGLEGRTEAMNTAARPSHERVA